jgi:hypothetical protein
MNKEISDPFWHNEYEILWKKERLTEFFPNQDQTLEEKFNSLVRLSFYCSVILYFYHDNLKYFAILIGTLLLTYYVYTNKPNDIGILKPKNQEQNVLPPSSLGLVEKLENDGEESDKICTQPTIDNPFMNVTMKDLLNQDPKTKSIVDRPPACSSSNPDVKKKIDEYFDNNLYKDVNDVFGKMNSQRQFYTMPWTTIPNAQDEFAKWLYLNPKTCKEDQDFCLKYEDVRSKRPEMYNPNVNPVSTKS